ncbi:NrdR family transcriptional regulator [Symmachiella macrocystis]|uniref:NrdR family transcriptional regulator n=1 Tax=Symmachiella macrocystis TaxID=2527985 RepID=UPI0036F1E148
MREGSENNVVNSQQRGLQCRACGHQRFRVINTRAAKGGKLLRRRDCRKCGERITTWELAVGDASG